MMQGVVDEAKQVLREMPGFAIAVVLLVAMCAGMHAAIFYEADGEGLRLIADRGDEHTPTEAASPVDRLRSRMECAEKRIPGFTVIVGLSHYNVELSVPMAGMHTMFEDARADIAHAVEMTDTRQAA